MYLPSPSLKLNFLWSIAGLTSLLVSNLLMPKTISGTWFTDIRSAVGEENVKRGQKTKQLKHYIYLAKLKSCNTTKSLSMDDNIYIYIYYIYIYIYIYIYALHHRRLSTLEGKCVACHIRWNAIALLKKWALQVADNVYDENVRKKFLHLRWEWWWLSGKMSDWCKVSRVSIPAGSITPV